MYAILNDRGRQFKVREGEVVRVDLLSAEKGAEVVFDQIMLVGQDDGQVKVGAPAVAGARVKAVVEDHVKGEKTISHHRVRTNSLGRRRGHRTQYSVIRIQKIEV
jgi:large subunit ribosomal protein L21